MKNFLAFLSVGAIALLSLSVSPYSYVLEDATQKAKAAIFSDGEDPVLAFFDNFRKTLTSARSTVKPLPTTREHSFGWAKVEESVSGQDDGPVFSTKSVSDSTLSP